MSKDIAALRSYDPKSYRLTMFEQNGAEPIGEPIAWPWTDLTPRDFVAQVERPGAIMVVGRDAAAKLTTVPNGGHASVWVKTADGKLYVFAVRPLLPDEL